jgi:hypothetical protein
MLKNNVAPIPINIPAIKSPYLFKMSISFCLASVVYLLRFAYGLVLNFLGYRVEFVFSLLDFFLASFLASSVFILSFNGFQVLGC